MSTTHIPTFPDFKERAKELRMISFQIQEAYENGETLDEGFFSSLIGGTIGFMFGKKVGQAICRVLKIHEGPLFEVLTSKTVTTAVGAVLMDYAMTDKKAVTVKEAINWGSLGDKPTVEIHVWYDPYSRNWVAMRMDDTGYDMESDYSYNKSDAIDTAKEWCKEHKLDPKKAIKFPKRPRA